MTTKTKLTPQQAKTFSQIRTLSQDGASWGDYFCVIDETTIAIVEQKYGEQPKQKAVIPRHVFEKFVRWYQTGSMKKTP